MSTTANITTGSNLLSAAVSTTTAADIEAVKADYVAYIIECAQYDVDNA
ncbi:MAG: hypothetical protein NC418_06260 [Muribaculaceae bacterium]|nr:hypothetical protein [Muribaculaceae bacterium]